MRVVVINHVTLDGVMQSPGDPDEDTRGGFSHGGWAAPRSDDSLVEAMTSAFGEDFAFLFGRWSYEDMLESWNRRGGPFKDALNNTTKYVVSSSDATTLAWPSSTLVAGDAADTVARLKGEPGGNLVVMGSGKLVRSLLPHGLVDELLLFVHPVLLGSGQPLFGPAAQPVEWELEDASPTTQGVVITRLRRARA